MDYVTKELLLAYNDVAIREILYELLSDLGYKITTVPSYKETLESLKRERPDYIIWDPKITDISPELLLSKIKNIDDKIKIIILPKTDNPQENCQYILKALKEETENPETRTKQAKEIQLSANILIVDDENDCVELLKSHLARKGYTVDSASSGEETLLKIKTSRPDIVLLDIRMFGMDGLITLKQIKDIDDSINVIMTSAVYDKKIIEEATKLGAKDYLIKPFNMIKLDNTILNCLIPRENNKS